MGGSFVVEDCPGVLWFFGSANTLAGYRDQRMGWRFLIHSGHRISPSAFMGSGMIDSKGKDQKENALYINFHTIDW